MFAFVIKNQETCVHNRGNSNSSFIRDKEVLLYSTFMVLDKCFKLLEISSLFLLANSIDEPT